jgi:hypothetical protein
MSPLASSLLLPASGGGSGKLVVLKQRELLGTGPVVPTASGLPDQGSLLREHV